MFLRWKYFKPTSWNLFDLNKCSQLGRHTIQVFLMFWIEHKSFLLRGKESPWRDELFWTQHWPCDIPWVFFLPSELLNVWTLARWSDGSPEDLQSMDSDNMLLLYIHFLKFLKLKFFLNLKNFTFALECNCLCCVSFCGAMKWVSYMHTYIPSLLNLPSVPATPPL